MRIVQINTVKTGCTGRIAKSIQKTLENRGDQCILAYGRGDEPTHNEYKIGTPIDANLHGLWTRIFDSTGRHSKFKTAEFIRFLEVYKPNIIHIHNLHGYYINYPMLFSYIKEKQIKTFWTLHDCWPFTGHCPYYTYINCEKWISGCHHCPRKRHYPTSYIFDRSMQNYRDKKQAFSGVEDMTLISPSLWLKNEVKKSMLRLYPVEHIPNGISLTDFKPTNGKFREKYGIQEETMILGVANGWAPTKGMEYFLELSKMLDSNYKIVLVGLTRQQKLKLPAHIIGIEKTESLEELAMIYSSADIFVNPTSEDNFPTTNIEALACGTPVVTFNVGGSPEAIDNTCGIVVEKSLTELKQACTILGRKNQKRVTECITRAQMYDEKVCFGKYIDLYEQTWRD